jgi:pyruvate/2-oxoglutarate dehydrogenase complex dihydrolipoamide dehydrogenase (E3) component
VEGRAEAGAIGVTEREARASGRAIRVAELPMSSVARALEVDETPGFMKAIVDLETKQILGSRALASRVARFAALFQIAMMGKLPYMSFGMASSRIRRSLSH